MSDSPRRGVVVTGPPRSGTSATTRLLHLAGLHLCLPDDRVGGGVNNPTGHWESKTVLAINTQLMEAAGTRWWCPPRPGESVDGAVVDAARAFRAAHARDPWLCKDPRFAVTLPFWRRALGDRIVCVVLLRRPDEVVASLQRTWPLRTAHAAALWARYLHCALAVTQEVPVVIARFPEILDNRATESKALHDALASSGLALGPVPHEEWERFVRPPRGTGPSDFDLPAYVWSMWDALVAVPPGLHTSGLIELAEHGAVEAELAPLRDELRAGRPLDIRPVFARSGNTIG